jgi:serine/threonine protein kinase
MIAGAGGTVMVGETISHYRILEKLGEGGMGVVWKALDTRLDRSVAIKMLKEDASGRLEREARAVAALNHPNICQVYDVGPDYLVMELVEGGTLAARLKARPLKLSEALRIAQEAADGLRAAHEKDIVHRDVKSANILMTPSGQAKLTDFGLVFLRDATRLTQTGVAVGTAGYMSPEHSHVHIV